MLTLLFQELLIM